MKILLYAKRNPVKFFALAVPISLAFVVISFVIMINLRIAFEIECVLCENLIIIPSIVISSLILVLIYDFIMSSILNYFQIERFMGYKKGGYILFLIRISQTKHEQLRMKANRGGTDGGWWS